MILIALKEEEIKRFNELDDQIMTGCDLPEDLAREYVELKEKLEQNIKNYFNGQRFLVDTEVLEKLDAEIQRAKLRGEVLSQRLKLDRVSQLGLN